MPSKRGFGNNRKKSSSPFYKNGVPSGEKKATSRESWEADAENRAARFANDTYTYNDVYGDQPRTPRHDIYRNDDKISEQIEASRRAKEGARMEEDRSRPFRPQRAVEPGAPKQRAVDPDTPPQSPKPEPRRTTRVEYEDAKRRGSDVSWDPEYQKHHRPRKTIKNKLNEDGSVTSGVQRSPFEKKGPRSEGKRGRGTGWAN